MKVWIFGANGMLGNYISTYLQTIFKIKAITRNEYNISDLTVDNLREFLKDLNQNDVVINCAGVIPQRAKPDSRLYFTVNSLFPVILSQLCSEKASKMIHITTDCVFSGKISKKYNYYNEDCIHDETNDYGVSKSLGEKCDATIIRTSIIGEEKKNKKSLLEWVKKNKEGEIDGFVNHFWNGVTCLQLAKIIKEIIQKNLFWKGVRHVHSPLPVSKYELIDLINKIYKLNITINPRETDIPVDKTLSSLYESFEIPSIEQQIKEMKDFQII